MKGRFVLCLLAYMCIVYCQTTQKGAIIKKTKTNKTAPFEKLNDKTIFNCIYGLKPAGNGNTRKN